MFLNVYYYILYDSYTGVRFYAHKYIYYIYIIYKRTHRIEPNVSRRGSGCGREPTIQLVGVDTETSSGLSISAIWIQMCAIASQ